MSDPQKIDFINIINTLNTNTEKTTKTFSLNKNIYVAGKQFARLLIIDHSQLLDKAVVEYIKNHQTEVPITFNFENTLPKVLPELVAALETDAAEQKRLLNQHIAKLKRSLTKPTPIDTLNRQRRALHTQVARTRRFLKSAKGFRDPELPDLFKEADKALADASARIEEARQ